jgi:hypothetical protein
LFFGVHAIGLDAVRRAVVFNQRFLNFSFSIRSFASDYWTGKAILIFWGLSAVRWTVIFLQTSKAMLR